MEDAPAFEYLISGLGPFPHASRAQPLLGTGDWGMRCMDDKFSHSQQLAGGPSPIAMQMQYCRRERRRAAATINVIEHVVSIQALFRLGLEISIWYCNIFVCI